MPLASFAQSDLEGTWAMEWQDDQGNAYTGKVSMAEGAYTVDLDDDGTVDIYGKYEIDGDEVSIMDEKGEAACEIGKKGVYGFSVEGNTLTMTRKEDACEGRGGPEGVMQMTRVE